jgi:hypothetical protein
VRDDNYIKEINMCKRNASSILTKGLVLLSVCLLFTGCFIFYDGSFDGFSIDGIYDGGLPTNIKTCSDATVRDNLLYVNHSFDFPTDPRAGALSYFVNGGCFPADAPTGFSRFDFVSPPLTSWDDVTGYNFTLKSFVPSVQVQPLLVVSKADGSIVFQRMVDDFGDAIFIGVPVDTNWHTYTFERPVMDPGDSVIELRVRVFIPNAAIPVLDVDSFIYLDTVVPLRSS